MSNSVISRTEAPTSPKAEAIALELGERQTLDGRFEHLSEADQIERMKLFADLIVRLSRVTAKLGGISSSEAVKAIADHFGVPTSDVYYGLLYASRTRRLTAEDLLDGDSIL